MVVTLPDPQGLLHQQIPRHDVRTRQTVEAQRITGYSHARLDHHEGAQRCQQTVGIDILICVLSLLFQASAMEDGQCRVHVGEEKLDAVLDHVAGQEARRRRERRTAWWAVDAVQSIRDFGGERRLSLGFAEFADDFRSRSFGALLLRDGVVSTGQLGRGAVATRIDAVALDFATMAGIAGPLDRRRHGGEGVVGEGVDPFALP